VGAHEHVDDHDCALTVQHGYRDFDPVEVPQLLQLPTAQDDDDVTKALDAIIEKSSDQGLGGAGLATLKALVFEFADIWRLSLCPGPPAKLPPLTINLQPDAIPVRVKLRRYPQEQRDFLKSFVDQLVSSGLAYRNASSTWCSAALLVPKPGPARFRFTVDLRPVNKQTVPLAWPMPHIESELSRLQGSTYFATFDLSHGYWQLELAPESQECQSFITPDGVFSPTRVLHGTSNAVLHLQAALQGVLKPLE
jgi:hypothetical protein